MGKASSGLVMVGGNKVCDMRSEMCKFNKIRAEKCCFPLSYLRQSKSAFQIWSTSRKILIGDEESQASRGSRLIQHALCFSVCSINS